MKYRAKCTNCIAQMCNTYPRRKKNPIVFEGREAYLENLNEQEATYVEAINRHMAKAEELLTDLIAYIQYENS